MRAAAVLEHHEELCDEGDGLDFQVYKKHHPVSHDCRKPRAVEDVGW